MAKKLAPKPKKKTSDPEQYKRFLATAEKVGASDDAAEFDRAFKKVARQPKASR